MTKILSHMSEKLIPKLDIKVVFFDVDGTLLREDGSYSQATVQQVKRIQSLGIKTAAATGRPHYAADFLAKELGIDDMGVYCTGAHVYQPSKQITLQSTAIEPFLAKAFVTDVRVKNIYYEVYTDTEYGLDHELAVGLTQTHSHHLRCAPMCEGIDTWLETRPVHKFMVGEDTSAGQNALEALEAAYPELIFAYAVFPAFPTWRFASVIDSKACKRSAFESLLDYYQVKAENVASFGDSQSDITFLQAAGAGVALGNASEQVKSFARFVTHGVAQDGVAYALSRLI